MEFRTKCALWYSSRILRASRNEFIEEELERIPDASSAVIGALVHVIEARRRLSLGDPESGRASLPGVDGDTCRFLSSCDVVLSPWILPLREMEEDFLG